MAMKQLGLGLRPHPLSVVDGGSPRVKGKFMNDAEGIEKAYSIKKCIIYNRFFLSQAEDSEGSQIQTRD
jgi:hypothetical protein